MRHPILSTITKELFNFRSRAQGYLALFPELQARPSQPTKSLFIHLHENMGQTHVYSHFSGHEHHH